MKDEARQSEAGGRLWLPRLVGDRCDMSHFAVFPTVIYLHLGSVKSYCMCQKTLKIYSVYQEKDAVLFKKAMTVYTTSIKVDSRFGFVGHLAKWCHMHGPFEPKSTGKRGNPPDLGSLPFNKQPFLHIFAIQKSEYNHGSHDTWQSWFGIATFSPFSSIVLHHFCVRLGWLASEVDVSPSNSWQGCNVPRVIDVENTVTTQSFSVFPRIVWSQRRSILDFFQRCSISENEPSQEGQTFVKETSKFCCLLPVCEIHRVVCFRNGNFCNFAGCRKAF